eukprot:9480485-Pyramimonas_sp.AAC.1
MARAFLARLRGAGWAVPVADCTWCTTASDDIPMQITIDGKVVTRAGRSEGFQMLGANFTMDNSFEKELGQRVTKARARFNNYRGLFTHKRSSSRR